MPGCAVHFEIAARMLQHWEGRADDRPFPTDDASCRAAFLFGSIAPDLGYFPGGDSLLADLAHCVRPADMARDLVRSAVSDTDRALAWGWATHVFGDVWIHPLINQAVGEHISGRRLPGLNYAEDPFTHMRVELGLDAILPVRSEWPAPMSFSAAKPWLMAVDPLTQAYRRTYGFEASGARMRVSNHFVASFLSILLLNGRVFSGRQKGVFVGWFHRALGGLARRFQPGRPLEALTNPLSPPDWLLVEAGGVVDSFVERFEPYYASRLSELPDYNLDTGQVEGEPPTYPLTIAALEELGRRNSSLKA
jgi:hypothetical protein